MSFILDALKKSEQERRRQQAPNVTELPYGRRAQQRPWWLWLVIALLSINLLVVTLMWLRNKANHETTPVATSAASSVTSGVNTQPEVSTQPIATGPREIRGLEEEAINPADPQDTTSLLLSDAAAVDAPPLIQAVSSTSIAPDVVKYSKPVQTGQVPTLDSLGGAASLNLPEIRLDLHVYSDNKAQRFVFINSKKYTEGQTLSEGPVVEQINDGGVLLSYRGQSFLLAKQ